MLLGYPEGVFFERLPLVVRAVAELPRGKVRSALLEFCEYVTSTPEPELCRHYVDVFDLRRRRSLHMTYYTDGDTRRRGHALTEVKRVYTEAGWTLDVEELPDHLAVILEFAARGDAEAGGKLLTHFRPAIALLGKALHAHGTPYARVIDAVCLTLPQERRVTGRRFEHWRSRGHRPRRWGWNRTGLAGRCRWPRSSVTKVPRVAAGTTARRRSSERTRVTGHPAVGILPYVVLVLLIGGLIWRHRYDKFGWTHRSSELYESRLLRIGSPSSTSACSW